MPMKRCAERGCPERSPNTRCPNHEAEFNAEQRKRRGPRGTTTAWAKARKKALERDGYKCVRCGKTQAELQAEGLGLEVHHKDGRGVSAQEHDLDQLETLCRKCHGRTFSATLQQRKANRPPSR